MKTLASLLSSQRKAKKISLKKVSADLLIKEEHLSALESGDWSSLPEPTFVKGFIRNYSQYLGLDPSFLSAVYRREYDEAKYPKKPSIFEQKKRLMLTPNKLVNAVFILATLVFVGYLTIQYLSILSAPKLEVFAPSDDLTTNVPYVIVSGKTEKETTVAINGEFVPIDSEGNFSYQVKLDDGKNIIEVTASKRLSPKSKVIKIVRLTP